MPKIKKPKSQLTVHEIKEEILALQAEGLKIISHFEKMKEYYSDWEDRFNKIEAKLQELEENTGLNSDEILEPTLEDALNV
jgi:ribulose 1,5-bisphosphate carboxylase large subunit-like protein